VPKGTCVIAISAEYDEYYYDKFAAESLISADITGILKHIYNNKFVKSVKESLRFMSREDSVYYYDEVPSFVAIDDAYRWVLEVQYIAKMSGCQKFIIVMVDEKSKRHDDSKRFWNKIVANDKHNHMLESWIIIPLKSSTGKTATFPHEEAKTLIEHLEKI